MTLALSASPDISSNPTDIALVLDRSGSMAGSPLANMKEGAKAFIDIIQQSTNPLPDGTIGSGSQMGIVSFAATATTDTPLTTSVDDLKNAVDALIADGSTNHADAFSKAIQLFDPMSSNAKVIVLFTDGKTTAGPPPAPVAAAARASGIIIYCIGLVGSNGVDVNVLNDWATDPDASHVAVTPEDSELEELFRDLASNISKTGATDIVIDEVIQPDFVITSVTPPTKGTTMMVDSNTLQWKIQELGVSANEGASLEFFIRHVGNSSGEKLVNQSISYSDNEGNVVVFPDPSVTVECDHVVQPEPCPVPVELTMEGCQDSLVFDLGDTYLESLGRILQLNVTIKDVCPGKRVALAIFLTEVGFDGQEHSRGLKTMVIPAHQASGCRDIQVKCIKFVLPKELDVSGGLPEAICNPRKFKAWVIAHAIDTDFRCCDTVTVLKEDSLSERRMQEKFLF